MYCLFRSEFSNQMSQPSVDLGQQFVQISQPNARQKKYVYNATANATGVNAGENRCRNKRVA